MPTDFYTQWLGVKPGTRPPDHYALLCLPPFTHAARAIEAAARAQLDKLDQYAISPDKDKRAAATRMMNEVAAARLALSDPLRRDQYDRELSAALGIQAPQPDEMGETVVGHAPVVSAALDIGAREDSAAPGAAARDQMAEEVFGQGAKPLQEMEGPSIPRRRLAIPFTVVVIIGALALLLVAGLVTIVAISMSRPPPPVEQKETEALKPPPQSKVPPPPPPFVAEFDETSMAALGKRVEIRRGKPTLREGALVLASSDEGEVVALWITPLQQIKMFREATASVRLQPGAQFKFGLVGSPDLTVSRTKGKIEYLAKPGRRIADDNGNIVEIPDADQMTIRMRREEGSVNWSINGIAVAQSPELSARGIPMLTLESAGPVGDRAAVDRLEVQYAP